MRREFEASMHINLAQWLFTDPQTATGDSAHPEMFHFYVLWALFNGVVLLAWLYYQVEGRRQLVGSHTLHKTILDKLLNQYALVALVGFLVMFFRWAADSSLLADRIWRYLWLLWLGGLTMYWLVYFVRTYPEHRKQYVRFLTHQQYVSPPKSRRARRPARAGSR
jgi:hypothetical protein